MTKLFKRDDNNAAVLGVLNSATNEVEMVHGENCTDKTLIGAMNYVWDEVGGIPIRMTQPLTNVNVEGDFTATLGDLESLIIGNYFKDVRYDYDVDYNCIYTGSHLTLGAATSDTDWYILRYDYTANNCVRKRFRITSWENRASGW